MGLHSDNWCRGGTRLFLPSSLWPRRHIFLPGNKDTTVYLTSTRAIAATVVSSRFRSFYCAPSMECLAFYSSVPRFGVGTTAEAGRRQFRDPTVVLACPSHPSNFHLGATSLQDLFLAEQGVKCIENRL